MKEFSRAWWVDVLRRSVRTFAQTMLGFLTANTFSPWSADWRSILVVSGLAALVSLMQSMVSTNGNGKPVPPSSGER